MSYAENANEVPLKAFFFVCGGALIVGGLWMVEWESLIQAQLNLNLLFIALAKILECEGIILPSSHYGSNSRRGVQDLLLLPQGNLKIKLCGKRLYLTESVKYLGVKIDINLSWEYHLNDLSIKLNRAHALLFKMRKYVSLKILRSIYFAIFDSYLSYCCLVWVQNCSTIQ